MNIGNVVLKNNIIVAPMAGITNTSFRKICKEMGCGLVVAEMVSDKAVCYNNKKTLDLLKFDETERPISQQIFGSDKESFVKATKKILEVMKPDIIDINMGCPVPKVALRAQAGSALLKNPDKIKEIVQAVVEASTVPVTVKVRSGWDNQSINAPLVAKICQEAGASAIFIHARTRAQGYEGSADWSIIKQVVQAVSIPVVGNGDVTSCYDAKRMLDETGCAGVMIGRGVLGNPFLIKECVDYLSSGIEPKEVSLVDKIDVMKKHIEYMYQDKDESLATLELRTNLAYYFKGLKHSKEAKMRIVKASSKEEYLRIISEYKEYMEASI